MTSLAEKAGVLAAVYLERASTYLQNRFGPKPPADLAPPASPSLDTVITQEYEAASQDADGLAQREAELEILLPDSIAAVWGEFGITSHDTSPHSELAVKTDGQMPIVTCSWEPKIDPLKIPPETLRLFPEFIAPGSSLAEEHKLEVIKGHPQGYQNVLAEIASRFLPRQLAIPLVFDSQTPRSLTNDLLWAPGNAVETARREFADIGTLLSFFTDLQVFSLPTSRAEAHSKLIEHYGNALPINRWIQASPNQPNRLRERMVDFLLAYLNFHASPGTTEYKDHIAASGFNEIGWQFQKLFEHTGKNQNVLWIAPQPNQVGKLHRGHNRSPLQIPEQMAIVRQEWRELLSTLITETAAYPYPAHVPEVAMDLDRLLQRLPRPASQKTTLQSDTHATGQPLTVCYNYAIPDSDKTLAVPFAVSLQVQTLPLIAPDGHVLRRREALALLDQQFPAASYERVASLAGLSTLAVR